MGGEWIIRDAAWPASETAAARYLGAPGELAWLDSASSGALTNDDARWSLFAFDPVATVEQVDGREAELFVDGRVIARDANVFQLLRAARARTARLAAAPLGLAPGWLGYIGFEAARQLEKLPAARSRAAGLPLARMALYDRAIILDGLERRGYAVCAPGIRPRFSSRPVAFDPWFEQWECAAQQRPTRVEPARIEPYDSVPRAAFERRVARALDYIRAGDIYQVNLAHRLEYRGVSDPLNAYARIREVNPAPYGAYFGWGGGAIASFSPELFLELRGRDVLTRPIKGTRPRSGDPLLDDRLRSELLASEKDAAELAMIVDLHRNDLGRVCEFGSVRVPHPRRAERHPTVHHTVADVVGTLREDRDAIDLLTACFPPGSISGVPKIRALEIIDEIEPVARGAYTGAIGMLGLDGNMTLNVAIRTLQFAGERAALYVGGGIVADSVPSEEFDETMDKAAGILRGLRSGTPSMHHVGCE